MNSEPRIVGDALTSPEASPGGPAPIRHARRATLSKGPRRARGLAAAAETEGRREPVLSMRRPSSLIARLAAVVLVAGLSGACVIGEEFQRGYLLDEQAFATVRPGQDAQQVLQTLGTPSTVSTVGNRTWYYISQKSARRVQFLNDTVVDQRVAAVYFNKGLKVERVALYGLQDGKVFDFVSRTTPTGGSDQNFIGQLFRGVASLNPLGS